MKNRIADKHKKRLDRAIGICMNDSKTADQITACLDREQDSIVIWLEMDSKHNCYTRKEWLRVTSQKSEFKPLNDMLAKQSESCLFFLLEDADKQASTWVRVLVNQKNRGKQQ